MIHRGLLQPLQFCDSVILRAEPDLLEKTESFPPGKKEVVFTLATPPSRHYGAQGMDRQPWVLGMQALTQMSQSKAITAKATVSNCQMIKDSDTADRGWF